MPRTPEGKAAIKAATEQYRIAHHRALETLRHPSCELSGVQLWRKCSRLERLSHAGATAYCNGETIQVSWPLFGLREYNFSRDEDAWEQFAEVATDCIRNIFGCVPAGFFVNGDARGYALKLDPQKVTIPEGMSTDWGGNGILAAEIK